MKCDTCKFKSFHFGAGAPDDYSMDCCAKGHWEGGELGEKEDEITHWDNCKDYHPLDKATPELLAACQGAVERLEIDNEEPF